MSDPQSAFAEIELPILRGWVDTLRGAGRRQNALVVAHAIEQELLGQGFPIPQRGGRQGQPKPKLPGPEPEREDD